MTWNPRTEGPATVADSSRGPCLLGSHLICPAPREWMGPRLASNQQLRTNGWLPEVRGQGTKKRRARCSPRVAPFSAWPLTTRTRVHGRLSLLFTSCHVHPEHLPAPPQGAALRPPAAGRPRPTPSASPAGRASRSHPGELWSRTFCYVFQSFPPSLNPSPWHRREGREGAVPSGKRREEPPASSWGGLP